MHQKVLCVHRRASFDVHTTRVASFKMSKLFFFLNDFFFSSHHVLVLFQIQFVLFLISGPHFKSNEITNERDKLFQSRNIRFGGIRSNQMRLSFENVCFVCMCVVYLCRVPDFAPITCDFFSLLVFYDDFQWTRCLFSTFFEWTLIFACWQYFV